MVELSCERLYMQFCDSQLDDTRQKLFERLEGELQGVGELRLVNSRWHGGIAVVVLGVLPITASSASSAVAASCESLATLSQANTTITSAQSVGAGEFMPPGPSESPAAAYGKLPAFCRVAATLRP